MAKTLGTLGLRNFTEKGSNKTKCPVAAEINIDDFMESKVCGTNISIVNVSGHQVYNAFMNSVEEVASAQKLEPVVAKMYVYRDHLRYDGYVEVQTRDTGDTPLLTAATPMKDLVFERVIGIMKLQGDGEFTQCVAFKYEPKYAEFAIGTEVDVCSNFNIFGGKRFNTSQGFKFPELMDQFRLLVGDSNRMFDNDRKMISDMKSRLIEPVDVNWMLGSLMQNYHKGDMILPLTDISALSNQIVKSKEEVTTVWDFVNRGTEVIRFDTTSGDNILETMSKFNDFTYNYKVLN